MEVRMNTDELGRQLLDEVTEARNQGFLIHRHYFSGPVFSREIARNKNRA